MILLHAKSQSQDFVINKVKTIEIISKKAINYDALRDFGSVTIWRLHGRSSACESMLTLCSTFISFLSVCMS